MKQTKSRRELVDNHLASLKRVTLTYDGMVVNPKVSAGIMTEAELFNTVEYFLAHPNVDIKELIVRDHSAT